jgi:hypothetical protein
MTDPDPPDEGGSDYGYDLAHDVPRGVREPASPGGAATRRRPAAPPSPLTGGDYGYDEAHGSR